MDEKGIDFQFASKPLLVHLYWPSLSVFADWVFSSALVTPRHTITFMSSGNPKTNIST